MKAKKQQAVITVHVGGMNWFYKLLMLNLWIISGCQRVKGWILRRGRMNIHINCTPGGKLPAAGMLTIAQAEEQTADTVVKALTDFKKRANKQGAKIIGENAQLKVHNAKLITDVREHQQLVKGYRENMKKENIELVQEIAELHVVIDRLRMRIRAKVGEINLN